MKRNLYFVENSKGKQFAVKLLAKGDSYGLDKCLTWDKDSPGVEFYDVTYAGDGFDEVGQFVSRYYASTILDSDGGLNLNGEIPEWNIDWASMNNVRAWMHKRLSEEV